MKKLHLLILAVAAVAVAPTALAQHAGGQGMPKVDANGDGVITKAEAAAFPRLAARFDELDRNKDGKLSGDERPMRSGNGAGRMATLDADKDGRISRAEAQADRNGLAARFDQLDKNKDGYIDRTELFTRKPGEGR